MKVDATVHAMYLANENQDAGGTRPAVPGRQPRIYPTDPPTQSGAEPAREGGPTGRKEEPAAGAGRDAGHSVSDKAKEGEQEKKPDKDSGAGRAPRGLGSSQTNTGPQASPSPSVGLPSGNSLQFKVGGMISAVPPLMPGAGSTPAGSMSRPGLIQRSNRAGHLGGSLIGSGTKTIKDAGGLAHAKDKKETQQIALQLSKDIANGIATGIDLSRVPHKKDTRSSYLTSPRRQGVYEVPQHSGHAASGGQIELKSMHNAPKDRGTQTIQPPTTHAGTQHASTSKSDAGTQVQPNQSARQTQAHTPTQSQASQATPQTHDTSVQTTSPQSVQTQPRAEDTEPQTPPPPAGGTTQDGSSGSQSPRSEPVVAAQTTSDHAGGPGSGAHTVPASVKGNGHWAIADAVTLTSDINNVKQQPNMGNITTVTAGSVLTVGDTLALINASGNHVLTLASKSLSLLGTAIGVAPSVGQLANDVKQLIQNPKDEQSKWNVANSAFQLGAGLTATAASLVFPPAALVPLVFPNLAEIGHAEILRGKKNDLRAQGLNTEAAAVEDRYKIAALDATPIVNWFSSTYTPELRPAIEKFETAQGNVPGGKPAGELPVNTLHDQRVYDYYVQAITERAQRLADAAKGYLKGIASDSNLSSVTMVSRCPQVFGWPTNGQAMRVFDRAVAISYDRVHDTIRAELFGANKDGTYRLPTRDPSLPSGTGSKNLLFYTNMLDPDAKQVKFDMPQYRADPSTFAIDVRKSADKA
ncbi:hypothetical protein PQR75_12450 [Paraburkholderia fungorum]|uniref:hypothetical protein n=1 Tax=Paraburkholderia fungorum TaxID=134537 RepID=UPI0038BD5864